LIGCQGAGAITVTVRNLRRIILGAASAASLFIGSSLVAAQDVVEIRLRGRYFTDPATIRITVAVEPNAENRALRIEADGDTLFRSSEVVLEGEGGKRIHTVEFKNLPAGNYTIRAAVLSSAQVRGAAEEFLTVGDPGDQQ
jgi:hypothetical protein